jgi:oligopeptide/dipeptide ABC transporter ATP-binding protein
VGSAPERRHPALQQRRQPIAAGEAAGSAGCRFHPRCPFAIDRCRVEEPALEPAEPGHLAACHRKHELVPWEPAASAVQGNGVTAMRLALYAQRKAENAGAG